MIKNELFWSYSCARFISLRFKRKRESGNNWSNFFQMSSRVETSFIFITFSRLLSLVTSILALVILKQNTKTHKNRQCRSIENNKSKIDIIQFPHMFEAWMEIFLWFYAAINRSLVFRCPYNSRLDCGVIIKRRTFETNLLLRLSSQGELVEFSCVLQCSLSAIQV